MLLNREGRLNPEGECCPPLDAGYLCNPLERAEHTIPAGYHVFADTKRLSSFQNSSSPERLAT